MARSRESGGIRYRLQYRHTVRTRISTIITTGPSLTGLRGTQLTGSIIYTLVRERTVTEREWKKALWKMPIWAKRDRTELSRTTKCGLVLSHAVPFYQPHATRPHTSARNGQLNGNPPVRAPSEGFRQGLGENWGKTKELGKTEYN
jgi:hypothetical protein